MQVTFIRLSTYNVQEIFCFLATVIILFFEGLSNINNLMDVSSSIKITTNYSMCTLHTHCPFLLASCFHLINNLTYCLFFTFFPTQNVNHLIKLKSLQNAEFQPTLGNLIVLILMFKSYNLLHTPCNFSLLF